MVLKYDAACGFEQVGKFLTGREAAAETCVLIMVTQLVMHLSALRMLLMGRITMIPSTSIVLYALGDRLVLLL